jgi:hypothetical protein
MGSKLYAISGVVNTTYVDSSAAIYDSTPFLDIAVVAIRFEAQFSR